MEAPTVGRNESCPCGSKKKYKRCCGKDAAPKLTTPAWPPAGGGAAGELDDENSPAAGMAAGMTNPMFDPSQMDPQMMNQMAQMLQRLPRGQMQRLQSLVQKAMAGKDVTREAAEFERSLPPDFKNMLEGFKGMPGFPGMGVEGVAGGEALAPEVEEPADEMSVDDARSIVAKALAEGKISKEQADQLLGAAAELPQPEQEQEQAHDYGLTSSQEESHQSEQGSRFSKLWKSMKGK